MVMVVMSMPNIYRDKEFLAIKHLVNMALFVSISIILSVFESLLPLSFILPGIKLGLANIVLLLIIDTYSFKDLLLFQFLRISITTFILGLFSVYIYSLIGGMFALIMMYAFHRIFKHKISLYTLSMIGAISHSIGQIVVAMILIKSIVLINYIPVLVIASCISGFAIAYITIQIQPNIKRKINDDSIKKLFS